MKRAAAEFDASIGPDGTIAVPGEIIARIGRGARLRVRLTGAALASELGSRGVDAEEMDAIAALQRESHEQVLAFLLAEGALAPRTPRAQWGQRSRLRRKRRAPGRRVGAETR